MSASTRTSSTARTDDPVATDSAAVDIDPGDEFVRIADRMTYLQHSFNRVRAILTTAAGDDSEWARNRVLFLIARYAPVRLSALAEVAQADTSTLSRQVASLVKSGLIERRADPDDGRASLLVLSETGRVRHDAQLRSRDDSYRAMLHDWPEADRRDFARLLERFAADYDDYRPTLIATASSAVRASAAAETGERS